MSDPYPDLEPWEAYEYICQRVIDLEAQLAVALELLAEVDVPADIPESRIFPYGAQSWVKRRNALLGEE